MLESIEMQPSAPPVATVIWLHGLGADGHDFEPIVPELNLPETLPVRFVFPHAPLRPVTINAGMVMRAWFDIVSIEGGHRIDEGGFFESVDLINGLIATQVQAGMPPGRIVLAGFSQGGAVVLHTGLQYPERMGGILALSCYLPTIEAIQKAGPPRHPGLPILMAHGTQDPLIPFSFAVSTRNALTALGHSIDWHEYDMAHAVCPDEIAAIGSWLSKVLGPPEQP